ncbi:sulfatase family protein [Cyclobacterium jeungdonense]|uniref:Sulfatase-like hydrolase/transferase n=1 Tax=Cyclobacterium jeungdonense TaxID=708087 RepID=A0ABT8C0C0_9BACT|nr:sulfatase-like hydrolase/transferase [Cyclobacterium jeungdonense]MDN3686239.1 sulfatase-like hydrolase/transferase [Cyclobacterium jeungdonense]
MRYVIRLIYAVLVCFSINKNSYSQPTNSNPPNIILIMADDLGWGDVGFNGNELIQTPELDAMAQNGLVMSRFYAASAVCSPTRGSFLTGRHPERYGITHANTGHMKKEELTLAELVKDQGYATGHFGKWHLGTLTVTEKDANRGGPRGTAHYAPPWENGFDVCFSTESKVPTWDPMVTPDPQAQDIGNRVPGEHFGTYYWSGENQKVTDNLSGDDSRIIMDRVIPFIDRAAEAAKPFLSVIWFHTPHLPVVAGPEYRNLYAGLSEDQQHYYGSITAMDDQIGRLRNFLREKGIAENTLILFCSDNGPEGPEQINRTQGSSGPFRGRKRSLYEGGIRVPALIEWPANIEAGQKTNLPVSTSDIFPSLLGILGIDNQKGVTPLDGANISPLIQNKSETRQTFIPFKFQKQQAIMDNRFKLYSADNGESFALFDLQNDPGETIDIAAANPEKVAALSGELENWLISCEKSNRGMDYQ